MGINFGGINFGDWNFAHGIYFREWLKFTTKSYLKDEIFAELILEVTKIVNFAEFIFAIIEKYLRKPIV